MADFHAEILLARDRHELLAKFPPLKGEAAEFGKQKLLEKLLKTGSEFFIGNAEAVADFIDNTDLRYDLDSNL
ncbi:unnamed protein product [Gongylonema pulchrum]|uniref:Site-specific DNA-methyltransferase (adenine-specific) n=1 Tax=Gongylonema pulchrum TaxID=637853 RepID=A0A183CXB6_9BILA|nr:unnamed protein product [Gongylonema pulchrum]